MASAYDKPPFNKAIHIEDSIKRVRVLFNGQMVVDAFKPKLVWEHPFYPFYYFTRADFTSAGSLRGSNEAQAEEGTKIYDLQVGDRVAKAAVTEFTAEGKHKERVGLFKFTFAAADAWFEEDERIYVHARDPYKRIDLLPTSRHIRVEVNGVEVANTRRAFFLLETGLRRRTYIPIMDTQIHLLRPSDTTTICPYKGWANYYNVQLPDGEVQEDVVWYYRTPLSEVGRIEGLLAFYDEKVTVWVDGVKQE